jgi:excisionase family DNA binding protein
MASKVKILKSKEVAHILDCSPDDVIMLARKGKLRAKKEGKYWLYRYADVMKYHKKTATA